MTVNSRETRRTRPLILCRLATAKQPAFSVISEYRRNERRDTLARFDSREGTLFRFVVLASRYFRDSFNASESVAPQSVKKKQRLAKIPPPPCNPVVFSLSLLSSFFFAPLLSTFRILSLNFFRYIFATRDYDSCHTTEAEFFSRHLSLDCEREWYDSRSE